MTVTIGGAKEHAARVMRNGAATTLNGYWRVFAEILAEEDIEDLAWAFAAALALQEDGR